MDVASLVTVLAHPDEYRTDDKHEECEDEREQQARKEPVVALLDGREPRQFFAQHVRTPCGSGGPVRSSLSEVPLTEPGKLTPPQNAPVPSKPSGRYGVGASLPDNRSTSRGSPEKMAHC